MNEIDVFDVEAGLQVAAIRSPVSFNALALRPDGQRLYAISSGSKSLQVFDTTPLLRVQVVENLGAHPATVLAVP